MHTCVPFIHPETAGPEERRNRKLRVKYGEIPPNGRVRESKNTRKKIGPDNNKFVIVGQPMNPYSRLPAISAREHGAQRHHFGPLAFRQQFATLSSMSHSLDDFHLNTSSMPYCTAGPGSNDIMSDDVIQTDVMRRRNSYGHELRSSRTAPESFGQRRWSDTAHTGNLETLAKPVQVNLTFDQAPFDQRKHKEGSFAVSRNISEYAEGNRKSGRTPLSTSINVPQPTSDGHLPHFQTKHSEKFSMKSDKVNMNGRIFNGNENHTRTRRNETTLNLFKNKKRNILIPSGDSSSTSLLNRTSSSTAAKHASGTKLQQRRLSKTGREISKTRKSESTLKNRRQSSLKPESPPGPSEEEMQELQLPVIRKFLQMPPSRPKVVCFDYPGVDLTHLDVKRAIEKVIPDAFDSGKVVSLQFENVNVKLATGGLKNRWYIEMKDFTSRNTLIKKGLSPECANKTNSLTELVKKDSNEPGTSGLIESSTVRPVKIEYPKSVQVKLHDSVSMEEYKLYLRRTAAEEKLQNVILLCAGRGDKLLSSML